MPTIHHSTSYTTAPLSKIKEIRTWDTNKYLMKLSETNNDIVFNEQTSGVSQKQCAFDKKARNEKHYNLNIYDIFFHPHNDIVEENINRILQHQYSHSPTFRRMVNYSIDN
ncbi:TPA: DUF4765 family protein, partial [Escherichia coli]|nr:DUF4765 family protein [Escherichia coli]